MKGMPWHGPITSAKRQSGRPQNDEIKFYNGPG
jgi:hypothetical protein